MNFFNSSQFCPFKPPRNGSPETTRHLRRLPVVGLSQETITEFSVLNTQKLYFRSYSHQILALEGEVLETVSEGEQGVSQT